MKMSGIVRCATQNVQKVIREEVDIDRNTMDDVIAGDFKTSWENEKYQTLVWIHCEIFVHGCAPYYLTLALTES